MPHSIQSFLPKSLHLKNMNIFESQENKHPAKLHNKKRLNHDQVRLLERSFTTHKKLDPELKLKLANQLAVPPRQVAIWYQNKRARWKTQSLELDYNTVQVKLENALAEKRRLEKDVKQLKEELKQAQQTLFALNQKAVANPFVSSDSYNTSCSERGSCSLSLHNEDVHGDHHLQVLQLDELYACLIGGGGSAWG